MQPFLDFESQPPHIPGDSSPPTKEEYRALIEQLKVLTNENGLMVRIVLNLRDSNSFMQTTQRWLKVLSFGLLVCTASIVACVIALFTISRRLDHVQSDVSTSRVNLEDVKEQTKKTDEAVAEVKEQTLPPAAKVELVPETDPKKAKKAPIKVRITPAPKPTPTTSASAAPSPSAVEVPLPSPIQAQPIP